MNLTELTTPGPGAFPVRALGDQLRLGTGFADDGSQDSLLEAYLKAAMATIEARIGKAILARDFAWEVVSWAGADRQVLPIAPVRSISALVLVASSGQETGIDPQSYRLIADTQRPCLAATGVLPQIPNLGTARVEFRAGFGESWDEVPSDLAQAVLILAAYFYERRHEVGGSGDALPFGVLSLIERYRNLRITGGGK